MLTRILGIVIALLFLCLFVATSRGAEPCGRDGCPVKVELVTADMPSAKPMPMGSGPVYVAAPMPLHPMIAAVRLKHPIRTFIHNHRHPVRGVVHHAVFAIRCR